MALSLEWTIATDRRSCTTPLRQGNEPEARPGGVLLRAVVVRSGGGRLPFGHVAFTGGAWLRHSPRTPVPNPPRQGRSGRDPREPESMAASYPVTVHVSKGDLFFVPEDGINVRRVLGHVVEQLVQNRRGKWDGVSAVGVALAER